MEVERPAYSPLVIDGLSYSDWEDDADALRELATGSGRVMRRHLTGANRLLNLLQDELDAMDGVRPTLSGFDAVRVSCIRDLVHAFRTSVMETKRLLDGRYLETHPNARIAQPRRRAASAKAKAPPPAPPKGKKARAKGKSVPPKGIKVRSGSTSVAA